MFFHVNNLKKSARSDQQSTQMNKIMSKTYSGGVTYSGTSRVCELKSSSQSKSFRTDF